MSHIAWRHAWNQANADFYDRNRAADHFSTSVEIGHHVAGALAQLARSERDRYPNQPFWVIDVGSGTGQLLEQLRTLMPADVHFLGVDIRERPLQLHSAIQWRSIPINEGTANIVDEDSDRAGVVIAHEFLDDIPCDIIELDDDLSPRVVLVDPKTGAEELGPGLSDPAATRFLEPHHPREVRQWLDAWWPVTRPGARREVGLTRQRVWTALTRTVQVGCAVAIDYAHNRADRATGLWDGGTVKGFSTGRPQRALPDGSVNITAHVALDALARPGATLATQAEILKTSTLHSWPSGLGSYTWLMEPIAESSNCRNS
jgi:SAM-dependent MidA family methyltransferase